MFSKWVAIANLELKALTVQSYLKTNIWILHLLLFLIPDNIFSKLYSNFYYFLAFRIVETEYYNFMSLNSIFKGISYSMQFNIEYFI